MALRSECSRRADRSLAKAILNPKMIHLFLSDLVRTSISARQICIAEVTCRYRERVQDVNRLESTCRDISLSLIRGMLDLALMDHSWIWHWREATHVEPVLETTSIGLSQSTLQLSMRINAIVRTTPNLPSTPSAQGLDPLRLLFVSHPTRPLYVPPRTCRSRGPIPIQSARPVGRVGLVIACRGWTGSGGVKWREVTPSVTMMSRFQRKGRSCETRRIGFRSSRTPP
jgi:hypothetical protein